MQKDELGQAFIRAMQAAHARAQELGKEFGA
jgi:pyrroline-5-carboxylate reductase